ncbi:unnamed protein product [Ixodes pacificus]
MASAIVSVEVFSRSSQSLRKIEKQIEGGSDSRSKLSCLIAAISAVQKEANVYLTELVDAGGKTKAATGDCDDEGCDDEDADETPRKKVKTS